jgi:SWI/SNF-related matrix-associated actin-dependent regulator 1 of chromatin subfamily A
MKLFPHQQEALDFISDKPGAILADDMGLGKTATAIMALRGLCVVVCPATLRTNWAREIATWRPELSVSVVGAKGKIDWGAQVIVINYARLNKPNMAKLLARKNTTVIFDEAHYLKSLRVHKRRRKSEWLLRPKGAARAKAAWGLVHHGAAGERVELSISLTGTPMPNGRHEEIFGLVNLSSVAKSAQTFPEFARRFCPPETKWVGRQVTSYDNNRDAAGLKAGLANIMLRRLKSEVLDLPEKTRMVKKVDFLDTPAGKEYRKIKTEFLDWICEQGGPEAAEKASRAEVLVQLGHLRQCAARHKIQPVADDIEQMLSQGRPVVIMAHHGAVIGGLRKELQERGIHSGTVTGTDSQAQKDDAIDAFQNGRLRVIICSIMAAGVGITLTASTDMFFIERAWRPSDIWQAEDRIYRIGQQNQCFITYYDCVDSVDEQLADMLDGKISDIASVIKCL